MVVTNDGESEVGECVWGKESGFSLSSSFTKKNKENEGVEVEEENVGR